MTLQRSTTLKFQSASDSGGKRCPAGGGAGGGARCDRHCDHTPFASAIGPHGLRARNSRFRKEEVAARASAKGDCGDSSDLREGRRRPSCPLGPRGCWRRGGRSEQPGRGVRCGRARWLRQVEVGIAGRTSVVLRSAAILSFFESSFLGCRYVRTGGPSGILGAALP